MSLKRRRALTLSLALASVMALAVGASAFQGGRFDFKLRSADGGEITSEMVKGDVERFELPNLGALNFLLHGSLGGGGTLSLMTDAQGKTFSTALLRMFIEVPDDEAATLSLAS